MLTLPWRLTCLTCRITFARRYRPGVWALTTDYVQVFPVQDHHTCTRQGVQIPTARQYAEAVSRWTDEVRAQDEKNRGQK